MDLYKSLVGNIIQYRFGSNMDSDSPSISRNIKIAKQQIQKNLELAFSYSAKSKISCIMLLAEMYNFYRDQPYYNAVRSSLNLRRDRLSVLEYLHDKTIMCRSSNLCGALASPMCKKDSHFRAVIVEATKYFVGTYPRRLLDFKDLLTREELLYIG